MLNCALNRLSIKQLRDRHRERIIMHALKITIQKSPDTFELRVWMESMKTHDLTEILSILKCQDEKKKELIRIKNLVIRRKFSCLHVGSK